MSTNALSGPRIVQMDTKEDGRISAEIRLANPASDVALAAGSAPALDFVLKIPYERIPPSELSVDGIHAEITRISLDKWLIHDIEDPSIRSLRLNWSDSIEGVAAPNVRRASQRDYREIDFTIVDAYEDALRQIPESDELTKRASQYFLSLELVSQFGELRKLRQKHPDIYQAKILEAYDLDDSWYDFDNRTSGDFGQVSKDLAARVASHARNRSLPSRLSSDALLLDLSRIIRSVMSMCFQWPNSGRADNNAIRRSLLVVGESFMKFANGDLRLDVSNGTDLFNCEPNSSNFFLVPEYALAVSEIEVDRVREHELRGAILDWQRLFPVLAGAAEVFQDVYSNDRSRREWRSYSFLGRDPKRRWNGWERRGLAESTLVVSPNGTSRKAAARRWRLFLRYALFHQSHAMN